MRSPRWSYLSDRYVSPAADVSLDLGLATLCLGPASFRCHCGVPVYPDEAVWGPNPLDPYGQTKAMHPTCAGPGIANELPLGVRVLSSAPSIMRRGRAWPPDESDWGA